MTDHRNSGFPPVCRRSLLRWAGFAAVGSTARLSRLASAPATDGLRITDVRIVRTRPRRPLPPYTPDSRSYWANREAARPIEIYSKYTGRRGPGSKWMPDPGGPLSAFTVEIATQSGIKGYGRGGFGGAPVVEGHLKKLLLGENPLDTERLWDVMWRATLFYGRSGAVVHAISAADLALWDIKGQALGVPAYQLLGGRTWERVPAYATGNDVEQSAEFGFKKVKLALPHGPADGHEGLRANAELVRRARGVLGPDGEIMIDCWMALTEDYTLRLAEALEDYRVYWLEEVLPPDEYEGFARLRSRISSTLLATGEHEYTRYGFRRLLNHQAVDIWQPDINWCGGMTELRRIGALATSHNVLLCPHAGGGPEAIHYLATLPQLTWAETTIPAPGGPEEVYELFAELRSITRGPEGIYLQPPEKPGFGWDFEVL